MLNHLSAVGTWFMFTIRTFPSSHSIQAITIHIMDTLSSICTAIRLPADSAKLEKFPLFISCCEIYSLD